MRALPEHASLRHLKLEAKRRRAAGEFPSLHDAQLAVAREHGQPSWTALRAAVTGASADGEGHAVAQLRWIAARFGGADEPGWLAPDEAELREHFTGEFLAAVPPDRLVARIAALAPMLRAELVVTRHTPFTALGHVSGHLITATTEPRSPYRLARVQERSLGERISDPRTDTPPAAATGPVPAQATAFAATASAQLGLVGLALAGASASGEAWTSLTGWASLERAEPLRAAHAFPAYQVTMAVTAATVLCLAADGQLRLDDRANSHLSTVQLADDAVTVRDLLAHTAGMTDPAVLLAPAVPALAAVTGPVIACTGKRGTFSPANAGYAALGEVIAGRTGLAYPEAVSRLVLQPLGMSQSWFPQSWPAGPQAAPHTPVTGYDVAADEMFTPTAGQVSVFPAAAGLWTTAADLARFGLGWSGLVPRSLAVQALRSHATQPNGIGVGLGWAVNETAAAAGVAGEGPGGGASLLASTDGRHACAALTNRQLLIEPVNGPVFQMLRGGGARVK